MVAILSPKYKEDGRDRVRRVFIELDCISDGKLLRNKAREFLIKLRDSGYWTVLWSNISASDMQRAVTNLNIRDIVGAYMSKGDWKDSVLKPDKYAFFIEAYPNSLTTYGSSSVAWKVSVWDGTQDSILEEFIERIASPEVKVTETE